MGSAIKGATIGVVSTVILYFIPMINFIAPVFGGAIGGYVTANGIGGGVKVGLLMALIMVLPGFLISGVLGAMLGDIPWLGGMVASGGIIITIALVAHTAMFGIVGAVIGGLLGGNKDIS